MMVLVWRLKRITPDAHKNTCENQENQHILGKGKVGTILRVCVCVLYFNFVFSISVYIMKLRLLG